MAFRSEPGMPTPEASLSHFDPRTRTLVGPPLASATWQGSHTLGGFLDEVSGRFAGNEALVWRDRRSGEDVRWSYADLRREVRRAAKALLAAGVGKGTRVGLLLPSRPEFVALFYAVPMLGGVVVPLSTLSARPELGFLFRHPDLELLVTQRTLLKRSLVEDLLALCPELAAARLGELRAPEFPSLRRAVMLDAPKTVGALEAWQAFLAGGESIPDAFLDAVAAEVHEGDPALIVYSSGTTSEPKGILHAQRSPAIQSWNMGQLFGRDASVRMWTPFPLFWTAGITTAMGGVFATGGCFVMQETFDPEEAIALIERERVTEPYYTRAHQAAAMEELPAWEAADFSAVSRVAPKEAFERHPKLANADPTWTQPTGFGMSETCAIFAGHPWYVPVEERQGSHGPLLPGNELRVLEIGTRVPLGPCQAGEIAIRGPVLMEHYVKKTREECFDAEGFLHTGDGGFFDEAGIVHWTGRLTEMIKTAGANVSPAEVELVLRKCEPLKAARIVGVPDEQRGEIVVLCATLKQGERIRPEEIQAWCRERLASYKVPRFVILLEDDEMPMTANQKIKDGALRELAQTRLRGRARSPEGAR